MKITKDPLALQQILTPEWLPAHLVIAGGGPVSDVRVYITANGCNVIHAIETGPHGVLRHASISHPRRHPTWDEITVMRKTLFLEDEDVMMVLPRKELYVNLHPHCFHLWQMPFRWEYA